MERKRDGLVPIAEALADLDGPVKAIRDATPQAVHHFTCFDQVNQLVGASRVVAQLRSGHGPIPVLFECYRIRTDSGMPRLDIRFSTSHLMMAWTR